MKAMQEICLCGTHFRVLSVFDYVILTNSHIETMYNCVFWNLLQCKALGKHFKVWKVCFIAVIVTVTRSIMHAVPNMKVVKLILFLLSKYIFIRNYMAILLSHCILQAVMSNLPEVSNLSCTNGEQHKNYLGWNMFCISTARLCPLQQHFNVLLRDLT